LKQPVKRGSEYGTALSRTIVSLTRDGRSMKDIAKILCIPKNTLMLWIRTHPGLARDVETSQEFVESAVEHSLFGLAFGASHKETKVFCTKEGEIVTHEIDKHYPPNFQAIQFLLKNINPEKWKDRQEISIDSSDYTVKNISEAIDILAKDPALLGDGDNGDFKAKD